MEVSCLELVLLLWVPGVLHAQTPKPCSAPNLDAGFFLPVQESYPHGTKISYSCNDGYKPAGKGWWGTSTCLDGEWFGAPSCVENLQTCSEPPKCLNAIIINQDYQEEFAPDSEVEYQCKDGHTTEEGATKISVFCRAGLWTDGPTCILAAPPCVLDPTGLNIIAQTSPINIKEGETKTFECTWPRYRMLAKCSDRRIEQTSCCHTDDIARGLCTLT